MADHINSAKAAVRETKLSAYNKGWQYIEIQSTENNQYRRTDHEQAVNGLFTHRSYVTEKILNRSKMKLVLRPGKNNFFRYMG